MLKYIIKNDCLLIIDSEKVNTILKIMIYIIHTYESIIRSQTQFTQNKENSNFMSGHLNSILFLVKKSELKRQTIIHYVTATLIFFLYQQYLPCRVHL